MFFLNKIDDIYKKSCELYGIKNDLFSCFIPIIPLNCKTTCDFLIKKQEKAKIMLLSGTQRVYISDLQIINTILEFDAKIREWFITQLVILYTKPKYNVQFMIENEKYEGSGIDCYPEEMPFNLFSDTLIDINDFIFVMNFIFAKDQCWEKINGIDGFAKRTICKYIALIDYYANKCSRSQLFLKEIGYPYEEEKPIDNKKTKNLFNNIEKFDISLYR
ncbi:hypothetical protein [Anaerotignum sp.]|uniref:hypothetical protein n=1 Tax=Anaerotignum sp. TaxID=2039241 RepID=UPI002A82E181|nr:hypothetical protein [Anaerotignum sp.]MDY3596894.1 hypothetical protein [Anaerotignum sp.]